MDFKEMFIDMIGEMETMCNFLKIDRDALLTSIKDYVFKKGTHFHAWVEDTERGIKCIDFKHEHDISIENFRMTTIALYYKDGSIIIGLHGYMADDEYKEDNISYYEDELSVDTLMKLYKLVKDVDMDTESWNCHKDFYKPYKW